MSEPIVDENLFWVPGPVWVVNRAGGVTVDDEGRPVLSDETTVARVEGRVEGERCNAIVVFTDRDLAERFIAGLPRPGQATATFRTPEHFAAFLQRAARRGETHVGFDPGEVVRFSPIQDVLDGIAKRKP